MSTIRKTANQNRGATNRKMRKPNPTSPTKADFASIMDRMITTTTLKKETMTTGIVTKGDLCVDFIANSL
jgi:hypothetical protein